SFSTRDLSFSVADSIPADMQPVDYTRSLSSALAVAAEIYPLGGLGRWVGNLGVLGSFERSVGLSSQLEGGDAESFDTVQQAWHAGLIYQIPVSGGERSVTGAVRVGYGQLSHTIDLRDSGIALPDVTYTAIDVGLALRLHLQSALAVNAHARYLVVTDAGELSSMTAYGSGSSSGIDAEANVELRFVAPIVIKIGGRLTRMSMDFDGTGALTEIDQAGEPDVSGASDTYAGGYVLVGYEF
ncbi:MAG: hypothetical protein AAGC55_22290, partial [Myxococcota bacterium]